MSRFFWIHAALFAAAASPIIVGTTAFAAPPSHMGPSVGPSVLATLAPLQRGSLPEVVTAFGTIGTSAKAKRTMMAPTSAVVTDIYVRSGQQVRKGSPLIRLGPSPGTAAAYTRAQSALSAAQMLVQRTHDLLDEHLATRQQLAEAQRSAADARATLAALKAEGAASPQTLRAPFDAIVTSVTAILGAIVNQGTTLLTLARPSGLVLNAGVVPEKAAKIHDGQSARVMPLGGATGTAGKVTLRGSIVDPRTGLVTVEIAVPAGSFLPGQTARATIVTAQISGYVVPHVAILVDDSGTPYVVQSHHLIARKVPVQVLLSAGSRDVVTGALDPQAPLVLTGNYQLQDGGRIRLADPTPAARR